MYYYNFQVVLQEVPGEISLCFSISGCPLRCEGCHSPFLWKEGKGDLLTIEKFNAILDQYANLASCVLFMGGEWHDEKLIVMLRLAKEKKYKTCLYTGEDWVSSDISNQLTWMKIGPWKQSKGGLGSKDTNQKFIEVKSNTVLNNLFIKN